MSFETFLLLVIIAVDVMCWWEARQANHVMKAYFKERAKWYERRYRLQSAKTVESTSFEDKTSLIVGGMRTTTAVKPVVLLETPIGPNETGKGTKKLKNVLATSSEIKYSPPTEISAPVAEKPEKSS